MNSLYFCEAQLVCFANDNDPLIPELWSKLGLAILEENMQAPQWVNRDFENDLRRFGDVVNTRRAAERKGRRRTDDDAYVAADANLTNVRVTLDQMFYDSFIIKDGEGSKSMQDLVVTHLKPAMLNIARQVDRAVLGRVHSFLKTPTQRAGRLGNLTKQTAPDFLLDVMTIMDDAKAYTEGRRLVVSSLSQAGILGTEMFVKANERGDGGAALERGVMGTIYGFNTAMCQNINKVNKATCEIVEGTVTNALAEGGSGSQAVSVASYEANVGEFVVIAGNDQPTYITARTASTNTTAVTLNEANKYATLASAVITVYKAADVAGAYAAGWSKEVVIDGYATGKGPRTGQLIAFGTGNARHTYTITEHTENVGGTETSVLLDRPLVTSLANNDLAFPGPAGSMNLAFHKDALALVTRPMHLPPVGVLAANADYNGVGMRVVMQYDSSLGGTRVNLDILAGTAVLDENLACVLLG